MQVHAGAHGGLEVPEFWQQPEEGLRPWAVCCLVLLGQLAGGGTAAPGPGEPTQMVCVVCVTRSLCLLLSLRVTLLLQNNARDQM